MRDTIKRVYVTKRNEFTTEADKVLAELTQTLDLAGLRGIKIFNRYDVEGLSDEAFSRAVSYVFSEPPVDECFVSELPIDDETADSFVVEYLPGQYDQRADSAEQCISLLLGVDHVKVATAKVYRIFGELSAADLYKIRDYLVNPVESRLASSAIPEKLITPAPEPGEIPDVENFITADASGLTQVHQQYGLSMSLADLAFCQQHFLLEERRNPTETELRLLDTYWSDHCRHTTFMTQIESVEVEAGEYHWAISKALKDFRQSAHKENSFCLMDLAVSPMKKMREQGKLDDLEISGEINACSILRDVQIGEETEPWLVMFKNETHNHPTEIEPFGGAATCLGGAIRDPLSGRSYVYQAMRVTGAADPYTSFEDTLPGKLPQRQIITGAAAGYSSYGNQVGVATGYVNEYFHPGYMAKRMEVGAVIAAVPQQQVQRLEPRPGDVVILVGGRTGRDGIGGATGSSKEHDESSLASSGAEVQKGNPVTERKLQRLFRRPEVSRLIRRCNDFGAGGVAVAVGELADGLEIDLDQVPLKYLGLGGTEIALSESQERMAVVAAAEDADAFIEFAQSENVEACIIAKVTESPRLVMYWRGKPIVNISRAFLDTAGVTGRTKAVIPGIQDQKMPRLGYLLETEAGSYPWLAAASRQGLHERFDSSIGRGTVFAPFGGGRQLSFEEGMAGMIPAGTDCQTATLMAAGFDPWIAEWSPFHGAAFAVLLSVAKIVAMGGDPQSIRLSLQEYFGKPGTDPQRWGLPLAALLGAWRAQMEMEIPAIGGKDSMSGSFNQLDVPPTLISFAVTTAKASDLVSVAFKETGNQVLMLPVFVDEDGLPDFKRAMMLYTQLIKLQRDGAVIAAAVVDAGGAEATLLKMALGNSIGIIMEPDIDTEFLRLAVPGSIIVELAEWAEFEMELTSSLAPILLGYTVGSQQVVRHDGNKLDLSGLLKKHKLILEEIFPDKTETCSDEEAFALEIKAKARTFTATDKPSFSGMVGLAAPRVLIPVFPGTNCEYDTAEAFRFAGGDPKVMVIRNQTLAEINASLREFATALAEAQILMFPGGFSAGDEPDGSGKFIAAFLQNPLVMEQVRLHIRHKKLVLGICNGFQALIKVGLLPYGEFRRPGLESPTLTFNQIGRHVSRLVRVRSVSALSPWMRYSQQDTVYTVAISHGEGRLFCNRDELLRLAEQGQVVSQYVTAHGHPAAQFPDNPNGALGAVEALCSPDGLILGRMGHPERAHPGLFLNVPGNYNDGIFKAGIDYFK
jgi:phosphoribosylformylglycinamidine synthase